MYPLNAQTIIKRVDKYVLLDTCIFYVKQGKNIYVYNSINQKIGEIKKK